MHRQVEIAAQKPGRRGDALRHYEGCLRLNPDDREREAIRETVEYLRAMLRRQRK